MGQWLGFLKPRALDPEAERTRSRAVAKIHADHADFVFRSLLRLGVRDADAEDIVQEVFIVVHRKLATYDPSTQVTTWLFGICLRVAAGYRRRAYNRRERLTGDSDAANATMASESSHDIRPDQVAEAKQARAKLDAILDELDVERRAIFVMFEIDEMSCEEIAGILGIAVGTVYSRLHAARKAFASALARVQARDAHQAQTREPRERGTT